MCRVSGQFQLIFSVMSDIPRSVAICVVVVCFASVALADDFKTIQGKEYKNVTVTRVEPDGIVLKTKSGISKVYFVELPNDVQQRFHYNAAIGSAYSARRAGRHQSTPRARQRDGYRLLRGLVRPVPASFTEPRANGEKRSRDCA